MSVSHEPDNSLSLHLVKGRRMSGTPDMWSLKPNAFRQKSMREHVFHTVWMNVWFVDRLFSSRFRIWFSSQFSAALKGLRRVRYRREILPSVYISDCTGKRIPGTLGERVYFCKFQSTCFSMCFFYAFPRNIVDSILMRMCLSLKPSALCQSSKIPRKNKGMEIAITC